MGSFDLVFVGWGEGRTPTLDFNDLKNKKPRLFHRGFLSTGIPQSLG